jgi:hypothetical protein
MTSRRRVETSSQSPELVERNLRFLPVATKGVEMVEELLCKRQRQAGGFIAERYGFVV